MAKTISIGRAKYFVTFINDLTWKAFYYFMKHKGKCFEKFTKFKALLVSQSRKEIKIVRSDNEGEYLSKEF